MLGQRCGQHYRRMPSPDVKVQFKDSVTNRYMYGRPSDNWQAEDVLPRYQHI
jgi:hypothetical protein